ncbi:hypothetical protein BDW62DRAFT_37362 [Aspergillus aurantiobrunneus]
MGLPGLSIFISACHPLSPCPNQPSATATSNYFQTPCTRPSARLHIETDLSKPPCSPIQPLSLKVSQICDVMYSLWANCSLSSTVVASNDLLWCVIKVILSLHLLLLLPSTEGGKRCQTLSDFNVHIILVQLELPGASIAEV